MREIKFRGIQRFRENKGKWAYGSLLILGLRHYIVPIPPKHETPADDVTLLAQVCECVEVDTKSISQSTGLKDKNGKDLDWWEGDILKKNNGCLAEIVFDNGCFKGRWIGRPEILPLFRFEPFKQQPGWFEIIGNIHTTPELLEKQ